VGAKLLLRRASVRRGLALLTPEDVRVLGGGSREPVAVAVEEVEEAAWEAAAAAAEAAAAEAAAEAARRPAHVAAVPVVPAGVFATLPSFPPATQPVSAAFAAAAPPSLLLRCVVSDIASKLAYRSGVYSLRLCLWDGEGAPLTVDVAPAALAAWVGTSAAALARAPEPDARARVNAVAHALTQFAGVARVVREGETAAWQLVELTGVANSAFAAVRLARPEPAP
jgi:hypothetical protein